ncbi:MAG: hypothetical protein ACK5IC_05590 [Moheibacter sp.]
MDFYKILQHFHSGWAYLTLLMGIVFFFMVGFYVLNKKAKDKTIAKISLITTLVFHVQMVIGVILYFVSPYAQWSSETMKDATNRLYAMEHPLMMFVAVILITITNSKIKKAEYLKMPVAILALLALAVVLSRIPWSAWIG